MPLPHSRPDAAYFHSNSQLRERLHTHVPRDTSLPQNRLASNSQANVHVQQFNAYSQFSPQLRPTGKGKAPAVDVGHDAATSPLRGNDAGRATKSRELPPGPAATVVSKRMLLLGLAFLPMVWMLHILCFAPMVWPHKCRWLRYNPPLKVYWNTGIHRLPIRRDVKLAFAGVVFWTIAFVAWFATFVASRTSWGATADAISVNIPPGY